MTTPAPKTMTLLPPPPDNCQVCAVYHHPDEPHSLHSMYYQVKFQQEQGRAPTWDDALADCLPDVQAGVREVLRRRGLLNEPTAPNAPKRRRSSPRLSKTHARPLAHEIAPIRAVTEEGGA